MLFEDENGRLWVSHGVNSEDLSTVVLPQEPWDTFRTNCKIINGEYILKERND